MNHKQVRDWVAAAISDGWVAEPTYKLEDISSAVTLKKNGWTAMAIAREGKYPNAGISVWGPDRLQVIVHDTYDFAALEDALRTCHTCGATDVKTHRYSFAGRCCDSCLPENRRKHEYPGWCD